jgi:hypothetical protein
LQHTPSAQKPEAQSSFLPHFAPFIFKPQLPFTHCCPGAQSLDCVHVSKHAPLASSHENGAQIVDGAGLQCPAPSHASSSMTATPSHWPALHTVPETQRRQAPAPSQVPSQPQLPGSDFVHAFGSRGTVPATRDVQVPMAPTAAHVLQASPHAVLQQTPSTQ